LANEKPIKSRGNVAPVCINAKAHLVP